jgi:hypothetical protein
MFCKKCGTENPDEGKFCRSCGDQLAGSTMRFSVNNRVPIAPMAPMAPMFTRRGKPISYESAVAKLFTGLAFIIIACIIGFTGAAGGRAWWFWMLIPGFGSLGSGIAQWLQIRNAGGSTAPVLVPEDRDRAISGGAANLPPAQQRWASAESKYKTGDLIPPSVTEDTTRHLAMEEDAQATKPLKQ